MTLYQFGRFDQKRLVVITMNLMIANMKTGHIRQNFDLLNSVVLKKL